MISVNQLQRKAKDRRPGCMGFAETMVLEYNGKKKSPEGKLSTTFIEVPKKDSSLIAENSSLPDGKLLDLGSGKL